MSALRLLACSIAAVVLLSAGPALAARRHSTASSSSGSSLGVEAGFGADYLPDDEAGSFMGFVAVDTPIASRLRLGGRFGVVMESDPTRFGIPLDARIRFKFQRVYLDGLAGPWLFFKGEDKFRFHAGAGFGFIFGRNVRLGAELGYLDPSIMIGVRVALGF